MDCTTHLQDDSTIRPGTLCSDPSYGSGGGAWVSVYLDGSDLTVFGSVDQLVEVGKLFLTAALDLRDAEARKLLDAATAEVSA